MGAFKEWNDPYGVQDIGLAQEVIDDFRRACEGMLECTGGSKNWNGETEKALKEIEKALGLTA